MGRRHDSDEARWVLEVARLAVARGLPLAHALASSGPLGSRLASRLGEGESLSEAMRTVPGRFAAPVPAMIAAGERASDLQGSLEQAVVLLHRKSRRGAALRAALVYPTICLAFVAALAAVQLGVDPLGRLAELVSATRGVPSEASGTTRMGIAAAAAVVAVLAGLLLHVRTDSVPLARWRLNAPLLGRLERLSSVASFSRALGALLRAGVAVDRAVAAALPATGNRWVEQELRRRLAEVRDGASLAASLALPGVFPASFAWRLAAGEQRGDLGHALEEAALDYDHELETRAIRLGRTVEPAGIALVGLVALAAVAAWASSYFKLAAGLTRW